MLRVWGVRHGNRANPTGERGRRAAQTDTRTDRRSISSRKTNPTYSERSLRRNRHVIMV
jgi:hypothetical protein